MKSKFFGRSMLLMAALVLMSNVNVRGQDKDVSSSEPWIVPSTITASQPFTLTLHFEEDQCNFDYPKVWAGVNLNTRVITLLYAQTESDPPRMCLKYSSAGPQFNLEGLPPGSYTIEHGAGPACAVPSDTGGLLCKYYIPRQTISQKLVVTDTVPSEKKFWFSPSVVHVAEKFVLELNSSFEQCNVTYLHKSVQVDEQSREVYLSYVRSAQPNVKCTGTMSPQTFDIPAISSAGQYSVYISELPACAVPTNPGDPVCMIKISPVKLEQALDVVVDSLETGVWFVPDTIKSESTFSLTLHFDEDQCRRTYRNMSVNVDKVRKNIYLSYVDMGDVLKIYCTKPQSRGPEFSIEKLAAGVYSVFYTAWPPCAIPVNPGDPACDIYVMPTKIQKQLIVKDGNPLGVQTASKANLAKSGLYIDRQILHIRGLDTQGSAVVNFYDARGKRVAQHTLRGQTSLALTGLMLHAGIYLAKVELDNGAQMYHQFIMK